MVFEWLAANQVTVIVLGLGAVGLWFVVEGIGVFRPSGSAPYISPPRRPSLPMPTLTSRRLALAALGLVALVVWWAGLDAVIDIALAHSEPWHWLVLVPVVLWLVVRSLDVGRPSLSLLSMTRRPRRPSVSLPGLSRRRLLLIGAGLAALVLWLAGPGAVIKFAHAHTEPWHWLVLVPVGIWLMVRSFDVGRPSIATSLRGHQSVRGWTRRTWRRSGDAHETAWLVVTAIVGGFIGASLALAGIGPVGMVGGL